MCRRPHVGFSRAIRRISWRSSGSSLGRRLASGLPVPVALETSAMPGQHRGGLDDDETGPPGGPETGQPDPEDAVPSRQTGSGHGSLEDQELMAERQFSRATAAAPKTKTRRNVHSPIMNII